MTDLPIMTFFFAIGVLFFLLLIAVEGAGLPRIMRRCDSGAKDKWKTAILSLKAAKRGLKDAKKAGEDEAAVESRRLEVTQGRKNDQAACDSFRKAVNRQVNAVRDSRTKPLADAKSDIGSFFGTLWTATLARIFSASAQSVSAAGAVLITVLAFIEIRYYWLFDFNVYPYLQNYSVPALLIGLLCVSLSLVLLPLIIAAGVAILPPLTGLLLIWTVDGMRALTAKGIARVFLAACHRWSLCSYLALPLLDEAPADSADNSQPRRFVEPLISFVRKYGSKLILTAKRSLTSVSWFVVGTLFLAVCYVAVEFVPRHRFDTVCEEPGNPRNIRVVLDPPLGDRASFKRIGSIGGNVFIVSESCELRPTVEKSKDQPSASATSVATGSEEPPGGTGGTEPETIRRGNGERGESLQNSVDVWAALPFVGDGVQFISDLRKKVVAAVFRPSRSIDVTVVPLGRILCMHEMHEVRDDQSSESAACKPRSRPNDADSRITVQETTDVRMDDEWRLKGEIAQRRCDSGAAEISEPVLFGRGEETPADESAARALIMTFLNKPELRGINTLHVLGFASGDGNSRYNENLAQQRATAVAKIVRIVDEDRKLKKESWGETHLTNGVANSRSVRIVGCRPGAEESSGPSG